MYWCEKYVWSDELGGWKQWKCVWEMWFEDLYTRGGVHCMYVVLIQLRGCNLIKRVCDTLARFNIDISAIDVDLAFWWVPLPLVFYFQTSTAPLPFLQNQLAGSGDGSLLYMTDLCWQTGVQHMPCALFFPTSDPPGGGSWLGYRLLNAFSFTFCKLHGHMDAVNLLTQVENKCFVTPSQHFMSSPFHHQHVNVVNTVVYVTSSLAFVVAAKKECS